MAAAGRGAPVNSLGWFVFVRQGRNLHTPNALIRSAQKSPNCLVTTKSGLPKSLKSSENRNSTCSPKAKHFGRSFKTGGLEPDALVVQEEVPNSSSTRTSGSSTNCQPKPPTQDYLRTVQNLKYCCFWFKQKQKKNKK